MIKKEKNMTLKEIMDLEKRMYFLVPYNISPIQQAIQAGHAALEYAYKYNNDLQYADFIENWKTWIILNGGTTNNSHINEEMGTLNADLKKIIEYNSGYFKSKDRINYSTFCEPDLNGALTAICLIVDERVFNRIDYPDFNDWKINIGVNMDDYSEEKQIDLYLNETGLDHKSYFLKDLLNTKKLA